MFAPGGANSSWVLTRPFTPHPHLNYAKISTLLVESNKSLRRPYVFGRN
jgi:hypothetical protein